MCTASHRCIISKQHNRHHPGLRLSWPSMISRSAGLLLDRMIYQQDCLSTGWSKANCSFVWVLALQVFAAQENHNHLGNCADITAENLENIPGTSGDRFMQTARAMYAVMIKGNIVVDDGIRRPPYAIGMVAPPVHHPQKACIRRIN